MEIMVEAGHSSSGKESFSACRGPGGRGYVNPYYTTGDGLYIVTHALNAMPDSKYHAMLMMGRDSMRQKMQVDDLVL